MKMGDSLFSTGDCAFALLCAHRLKGSGHGTHYVGEKILYCHSGGIVALGRWMLRVRFHAGHIRNLAYLAICKCVPKRFFLGFAWNGRLH